MKRFFSILALLAAFCATAWADTALFDFHNNALTMFDGITAASSSSSTAGDITSAKSTVVNGVTLTVNPSTANTPNRIWNDYNLGLQLRVYGGSFSIAAPAGKVVTRVAFDTSTWNAPSASSGMVGDASWSGSAANVTFTANGQIRMNSITVTFGEGQGEDPDPSVTKVDSLWNIETLADGTEFQFTTETMVNYQNGKYLYLQQMDTEANCYVGLLYGEVDKTYNVGDILPAGWKGKKTTYKGLVEVTNVTGLQDGNGTVDPYYVEPFDYTGYMSLIDETFMNYKVMFKGVTISDINGRNFTVTETDDEGNITTLAGFNQFDIELPSEGQYDITGMVSVYNSNVQLYPIAIESPSYPLWEALSYGQNGENVVITDELYVDYADAREKLVFVTDNLTSIYLEDYDFTMDWYPDWIAIDCSGNPEMFEAISQMEVIEAGSLEGVLEGMDTNPRIVVGAAPVASDNVRPEIVYNEYVLTSAFYPNAHEVIFATGKYNNGLLEGYVDYGDENSFTQSVTLTPTADLENYAFVNGNTYTVAAYVTIKDAWTPEVEPAPAVKPAPALRKVAAQPRKAPVRRVGIEDPDWFTNFEIHAFKVVEEVTGITGVSTGKTVAGVTYHNALGQSADQPFNGVNIVVTKYSDGSVKADKIVF